MKFHIVKLSQGHTRCATAYIFDIDCHCARRQHPSGVVIVRVRASSDGLDLGRFCKSASTATGERQRLQGSTCVIWYEMASQAEAAALVKSARMSVKESAVLVK